MNPKYGLPKNLMGWVEQNHSRLKPPVCNAALFPEFAGLVRERP